MKDRIKDYFAFNKKEQRGLIILLGLLLLSLLINIFLPSLMPEKEFDITPFQTEVAEFKASVEKLDSAREIKFKNYPKDMNEFKAPVLSAFLDSPFFFDPNKLSGKDWEEMGMDERIARNIMRYREKGGTFRDKEGFRKIYGMEDSVFAILSPYIRIAGAETKSQTSRYDSNEQKYNSYQENTYKKYTPVSVIIELNSADSASLLSCRGIGPSFAGRIIRYRNLLGGFFKTEQLLEVKGMDTVRYNQFRNQVTVNPDLVQKIDLNRVTFKDMLRHPYFEYYLVKAVFSYKDEIKAFDSVGQLRKIPVMYEELYEKLEPYLEVKN
jgi:DNA uptake protein ComE-like DNA-binding protein